MDWFKVLAKYPYDDGLRAAGEAAEVLFFRALAWTTEQDKEGHVPSWQLAAFGLPKVESRAKSLTEHGLWTVVDGGWLITRYAEHQSEAVKLMERKAADRERKRARKIHGDSTESGAENPPESLLLSVTNVSSKGGDKDSESSSSTQRTQSEDDDLTQLLAALAHGGMPVAVNPKTPTVEVHDLVDRHGVARLVATAKRHYQPNNPPSYLQAFLDCWRALPQPQGAVVVEFCVNPDHPNMVRPCAACAGDLKAGVA